MNMNMKNEKTMLALVLVAALAMVSVAGVALASESDAYSVNGTITTLDENDDLTFDISLVGNSTTVSQLVVKGTYTGTISFYTVDPSTNTTATPFAVVVCDKVSGVTFTAYNGAAYLTGNATTGTITLSSGMVYLGSTSAISTNVTAATAFTGTISVLNGEIVSENTYGATVTLKAATVSKAASVVVGSETTGIVSGAIYSGATVGSFTGTYKGITNVMLGNDLNVSGYKASATASVSKIALSGTLNKIVTDTSSAAGTVFVDNTIATAEYGFVFNNTVYYVSVDSNNKITGIFEGSSTAATDIFDYSGLKVGSGATTGSVSGLTGTLYVNVDASVAENTLIGATATVINNNALTVNYAMKIDGQVINNSTMAIKAAITNGTVTTAFGTAFITNYGTYTSESTSDNTGFVTLNGFYTLKSSTVNGATTYTNVGYASLADAIAAAETDAVYAGGYTFVSEDVTVGTTQTLNAAVNGTLYIDGSATLTVYGTFSSIASGSTIYIASEAILDVSEATYPSTVVAFFLVDVDGTFIIETAKVSNYTTISADTSSVSGSYTTYTNLYNALTKTTTGTVELLRTATLNKDATLASGVVFLNKGFGLTIAKDVTLTADGHFQFTYTAPAEGNNDNTLNILTINGTLIINDDTTPVTTGTVAGSFFGATTGVNLKGTLQVSEGAKFNNETTIAAVKDTTTTLYAGIIIVNGTFNNNGTVGADTAKIAILSVSSTGTLVNKIMYVTLASVAGTVENYYGTTAAAGTFNVETLAISGTFKNVKDTIVGTLKVETLYVTGALYAGVNITDVGVTVTKVAYLGTASVALDDTAITGTIALIKASNATNEPYAIVYGDFDASKILLKTVGSTSADNVACTETTTFYIGDDVYAIEYAGANSAKIVLLDVTVEGKVLVGWYTAPVDGRIVTANNAGYIGGISTGYVALYAILTDETVQVTFGYMQNGTWIVDNQNIGASGTLSLTVGTHTIVFVADNGYELGDDYVVYVDSRAITSSSYNFQNDATVTYGGEVKEKSTDGGLDLVTILLIIITIVIIIMAIIIALKLMRS